MEGGEVSYKDQSGYLTPEPERCSQSGLNAERRAVITRSK